MAPTRTDDHTPVYDADAHICEPPSVSTDYSDSAAPACLPGASFARTRYSNQFYVHMVCHPFEQMASVMEVVASGILDDHPRLRVGFFESGLGLLPYWLDRLDEHKETMGHLVRRLQREPIEIFSERRTELRDDVLYTNARRFMGLSTTG